jgi:Kef-type K+ transport system membrane component KefB
LSLLLTIYFKHSAILVAICGIIVPFAFAIPLIWLLGTPEYTSVNNLGIFYLFLGVVSSISALPVLARILSGNVNHLTRHKTPTSRNIQTLDRIDMLFCLY